MAVTLAKDDDKKNVDGVNLSVIPEKKRNRAMRTKEDLDKFFTERNLRLTAAANGMEYVDLYGFPIDTSDLIKISEEEARKFKIGVFAIEGRNLVKLASPSPNYDLQEPIIKRFIDQGYKVKVHLCSEESFQKLLEKYDYTVSYKKLSSDIDINTDKINDLGEDGVDLRSLGEDARRMSTSDLLERILVGAIQNDASDIHIEPEKEDCVLRFRLDGVLHVFARFGRELQRKIESRIKILSGLKLNVDNVPQDGRFSFNYQEKTIDMRVSLLPSNYGYSIVMRLLGTGSVGLDLDSLGFSEYDKWKVERAIQKPQGMILATGPTGSGKTTTLYTFLSTINTGEEKIITLEDPIEYKLSGISQTQIDSAAGYTFASGLRSILRQDPDAVMVGEIRDEKTADVAVQASLTGHKVLSTIHTNDAVGAVPRLMEMGVEGYLLADSLLLAIGQRLVRRLCPHCRQETGLTEEQTKVVDQVLSEIPEEARQTLPGNITFYSSKGCEECNGVGYKGRVGAYEVLTMTNGLRELLTSESPSFVEIREIATGEGMITMLQDAVIKAIKGVTDMDEVMRVIA